MGIPVPAFFALSVTLRVTAPPRGGARCARKKAAAEPGSAAAQYAVEEKGKNQNGPCSIMAWATFLKPAMLAPATRS